MTAPASSVIVTIHAVLAGLLPSRRGSSDWIGMTSVWVSAAISPPKHSAATAPRGWLLSSWWTVEGAEAVTGVPSVGGSGSASS